MTDHTDLEHAKMIARLMPERDLEDGDVVWWNNKPRLVCGWIDRKFYKDNKCQRLYTFSEIWAELPEFQTGFHYPLEMFKSLDKTCIRYIDNEKYFMNATPANAAAELLKWVKETASGSRTEPAS